MESLDVTLVEEFVNDNIADFHNRRQNSLENLNLRKLLRKNPYLLKAKNVMSAGQLIDGLLVAFLSSSEEQLFGGFLEELAVYVAQQTSGGRKSTAPGVDLEFLNRSTHYVVSVKSGPSWGNSSQQNQLESDLRNAVRRLRQSRQGLNIQPVLGICYGKTRTAHTRRGYLKVVGQNFWYLISENKDLYTDIIEPIGYKAKEFNDHFLAEKASIENRLTKLFVDEYCTESGAIDWPRLIRLTCGNYDMDDFMPS